MFGPTTLVSEIPLLGTLYFLIEILQCITKTGLCNMQHSLNVVKMIIFI